MIRQERETQERHGDRRTAIPQGAGAEILRALALGEKSVSEIVAATGLSQPNVSNHLARLRDRGQVECYRSGRQMIYRVATAGIAHFVLSHGEQGVERTVSTDQVAESFLQAVLTLKEEEAARVIDGALADGLSWQSIYLGVFVPTLVRVGELWASDDLTVSAEHLITGIITRLLHRLSMTLPASPAPNAPTALVGCVEGELHTVGGRMVADFLIAQGWRVWFLNGFLPAEHLLEAVHRQLPDAVVLCISTEDCASALQSTVDAIRRWRGGQPLPLIVAGGRYFDEGRSVTGIDVYGTDIEMVTRDMELRVGEVRNRARRTLVG